LTTIEQHQLDLHLAMALHEARDRGRHVQMAEHHRRGDHQRAGDRRRVVADRAPRFVDRGQDLPAVLEVAAALFGERVAARRAVEQAHAELRFERGQ
jgi:hypothetical protein